MFLSMFDVPSVARVLPSRARGAAEPRPGRRRARHRHHVARGDRHERRRSAAPRCTHRGREGAGPQHARRHQPGAGPRRRRHAEKCVAPIAVAPTGGDEERARPLRPAGRLYLRRIPSLRQRRRGRPERRRKSVCPHQAVSGDPHRRHAIHQLAALRARQFRGVADAPANAPHPDFSEFERRGQRRDRLEALWAGPQAQSHLRHQRNLPAERDQFSVRPGWRRARQRRREQEFHGPPRGGVFSRATSRSSATVRRSVSRTTACSPCHPGACTSSPTICRRISRTGTRNGPASYDRRRTGAARLAGASWRARATTFLDHPACWRRAARFSYAEALPAWRKRTHLPHVPAAVDEASLQALAAGLSTYFRPYRGPGHALRRGNRSAGARWTISSPTPRTTRSTVSNAWTASSGSVSHLILVSNS